MPKIAVYTIALNEAKFAQRWAASTALADYRIVADTGSTDGTPDLLRAEGVTVYPISIRPWRFDRARNASLALLPADADICICLDLDETLAPGWRDALLKAWTPETNRLRYTYIWSWEVPGEKPAQVMILDRIHARHSHLWRYPAHECAVAAPGVTEVSRHAPDLVTEHHPDPLKSRSTYLALLRLGAQEEPSEGRMAHYYGRELMFARSFPEAVTELRRHLALPATWFVERAQSMLYLGNCHQALGQPADAERWYVAAAHEAPLWRDPWVDLAQMHHDRQDWLAAWWAAERALVITDHTSQCPRRDQYWGPLPWDLASVCAWRCGNKDRALACIRQAIQLDPKNPRLAANLDWILRGGVDRPAQPTSLPAPEPAGSR